MKNKKIYITSVLLFALMISSCEKRLDIDPLNILTSDQVFSSESAMTAYMASLYRYMQTESFEFETVDHPSNCTDECINAGADQLDNVGNGTNDGWWHYDYVRYVNDLIERISDAPLGQNFKNQINGEAHFLRAYYYFSMVKRYGGIPIVDKVLNYTGDNLADLQLPRDTEEDCYDFIGKDLDTAALLLKGKNMDLGRATEGAALALKSRAMLYAGSIARYGTVDLEGIIGIPSAEADRFFQAAYDAAEDVIALGKYSLYNKSADKVTNFQNLFLEEGNSEAILSEHFLYGYKTHRWDCYVIPFGIRGPNGWSSRINPTLDVVEQFEYIDGSDGVLNIGTPANPVYYTNAPDLFANKDPRFHASVIVPFSTFKGSVIDIQTGIYDRGVKIEGDYSAIYDTVQHKIDPNGQIRLGGLSGTTGTEVTPTGFNMKKYVDYNLPGDAVVWTANVGSTQPWMILRYGEVLLNYAEAAVEMEMISDAKDKINQIRARAGIALLDDADITVARVRKERNNELAFENHRWYDLRRWRQSNIVMNNTWPRMLKVYYDVQKKAYRFESANGGKYQKTFDPRAYYERIPTSELTLNPNLVPNPGY